jgi:hypothetical protein
MIGASLIKFDEPFPDSVTQDGRYAFYAFYAFYAWRFYYYHS